MEVGDAEKTGQSRRELRLSLLWGIKSFVWFAVARAGWLSAHRDRQAHDLDGPRQATL